MRNKCFSVSITNYGEPAEYELPMDLAFEQGSYILGNYSELLLDKPQQQIKLKPYGCRVLLIKHG